MRFVASHESERVGWVYIIISCKLSDYHRCHSFLRALEANISLLEVRTKTLLFSVMNIIQMNLDVIGGLPDAEVIMQATESKHRSRVFERNRCCQYVHLPSV